MIYIKTLLSCSILIILIYLLAILLSLFAPSIGKRLQEKEQEIDKFEAEKYLIEHGLK